MVYFTFLAFYTSPTPTRPFQPPGLESDQAAYPASLGLPDTARENGHSSQRQTRVTGTREALKGGGISLLEAYPHPRSAMVAGVREDTRGIETFPYSFSSTHRAIPITRGQGGTKGVELRSERLLGAREREQVSSEMASMVDREDACVGSSDGDLLTRGPLLMRLTSPRVLAQLRRATLCSCAPFGAVD